MHTEWLSLLTGGNCVTVTCGRNRALKAFLGARGQHTLVKQAARHSTGSRPVPGPLAALLSHFWRWVHGSVPTISLECARREALREEHCHPWLYKHPLAKRGGSLIQELHSVIYLTESKSLQCELATERTVLPQTRLWRWCLPTPTNNHVAATYHRPVTD